MINDEPFQALRYLDSLAPSGPQNMTGGHISLNGVQVTNPRSPGFNQYTESAVQKWRKEAKLLQ